MRPKTGKTGKASKNAPTGHDKAPATNARLSTRKRELKEVMAADPKCSEHSTPKAQGRSSPAGTATDAATAAALL
eukprot:7586959-Lingulodinium_polyedra.AAC.1